MALPAAKLIDYRQSIERVGIVGDVHEPIIFSPLVNPVLIKRAKTYRVISQSGSATAWFGFLVPPAPLFADALISQPQISIECVNHQRKEHRTSWQYVMVVADDEWADEAAFHTWVLSASAWPTSPTFKAAT